MLGGHPIRAEPLCPEQPDLRTRIRVTRDRSNERRWRRSDSDRPGRLQRDVGQSPEVRLDILVAVDRGPATTVGRARVDQSGLRDEEGHTDRLAADRGGQTQLKSPVRGDDGRRISRHGDAEWPLERGGDV